MISALTGWLGGLWEALTGVSQAAGTGDRGLEREHTAGAAAGYNRTFEILPALLQDQVARLEAEQREARRDLSSLPGRSTRPAPRST